jgi:hypothetical protein
MLKCGEAHQLKSPVDGEQVRNARLKKLAARIDALADKDDQSLRHAREIAATRAAAAAELHSICAEFVAALNSALARSDVVLDPPEHSVGTFHEETRNLIQINVRGRILQVEYKAAADLVSTEEFRVPYTLEGSVRAFNQELLDRNLVQEQLLFYTLEKHRRMWRFFDARTYRSGPFDQEYLMTVMEQLI